MERVGSLQPSPTSSSLVNSHSHTKIQKENKTHPFFVLVVIWVFVVSLCDKASPIMRVLCTLLSLFSWVLVVYERFYLCV